MSDVDLAIRLRGVSKEFPRRGDRPTLFRALGRAIRAPGVDRRRRFALNDIDLDVPRGGLIGIVGENGAGKTTLLKTVSGLYRPSAGTVEVRGEVTLLVGLGAGMVDELSVSENIWLYGAICRIRRSTLRARFESILGWAELEGYAQAELRTLSTGMRTRLAFAIAMHIDTEAVLVDEAFSAGDRRFQDRCNDFFASRRDGAQTYLVATHNLDFVREFCDRALWLHSGSVEAFGPTEDVLDRYTRQQSSGT